MSLNTLGMLVSVVVMVVSISFTIPKTTGIARLVAFVVMLLAVAACLFFLTGVHTL